MQGVGLITLMVAGQFAEMALNTMIKAANSNGMSNFVYIVYSNVLALCILVPSTLIYHRKKAAPPLTASILCRMLLVGLLSSSIQTLICTGIEYSSPTLSSAMMDLVPAFTFSLAIISRMENLNLKLQSGQAKIIGTVVSIAGALMVTLYKGMPVTSGSLQNKVPTSLSQQSDWLLGGFLLAAASLGISILFIIRTWIIKEYPAELVVTTICCFFVVIISTIIAVFAEKNPKSWSLRPDIELASIIFSGVLVLTIRSVVYTWACRKKGPVFVAMFTPLGMVIALGMGVLFLGDALYLGSMIGAAVIAIGFYAVLWGQAQEEGMVDENNGECSAVLSSSAAPLLQNKSMNV